MGVSVHYWAVPPSSTLFQRLQREKAFVTLLAALFPYAHGIFRLFERISPEEKEEVLEDVIERHRDVLGPRSKAMRSINAFCQELADTRAAFPGVENRHTSLEKLSEIIEERLVREVQQVRSGDAATLVRAVMFGDQQLGRALGLADMDLLGLISAPLVRDGAELLNNLNADDFFAKVSDSEEDYREDFDRWRQLFRDAAAQGEVLLLGVC